MQLSLFDMVYSKLPSAIGMAVAGAAGVIAGLTIHSPTSRVETQIVRTHRLEVIDDDGKVLCVVGTERQARGLWVHGMEGTSFSVKVNPGGPPVVALVEDAPEANVRVVKHQLSLHLDKDGEVVKTRLRDGKPVD